jgi:hypothetical protein
LGEIFLDLGYEMRLESAAEPERDLKASSVNEGETRITMKKLT